MHLFPGKFLEKDLCGPLSPSGVKNVKIQKIQKKIRDISKDPKQPFVNPYQVKNIKIACLTTAFGPLACLAAALGPPNLINLT